jgi:hypothetical protein
MVGSISCSATTAPGRSTRATARSVAARVGLVHQHATSHHRVEGAEVVGQRVEVALHELDLRIPPLARGAPRDLEHARVTVHTDDAPALADVARDHLREVAVPAAEVEHTHPARHARVDQHALHHRLSGIHDHALGDTTATAADPRGRAHAEVDRRDGGSFA